MGIDWFLAWLGFAGVAIKVHAIKGFFLGGGWYVIMIASCGRGVEGVVPDDYNITRGGGGLSGPPIVITNFICQNMLDMVLQKW